MFSKRPSDPNTPHVRHLPGLPVPLSLQFKLAAEYPSFEELEINSHGARIARCSALAVFHGKRGQVADFDVVTG